ncbi:MAG: VWA domain-containing protein [Planctomycetes bacterium]|nr:VWA domain-containing protein [Planctomycetota bacterium]
MIQSLRTWWQRQTGEDETPLDGDSPAFFLSFVVHLSLFLVLALLHNPRRDEKPNLLVSVPVETEDELKDIELPTTPVWSELPADDVGSNSANGDDVAQSLAPLVSELQSEISSPSELTPTDQSPTITINNVLEQSIGRNFDEMRVVRGAISGGETGADGAIDRLTQEILNSLEQRKTLVVWLFDSTASLRPQRLQIVERFERVYRELGVLEAASNPAFSRHDDKPLLTSIVAFGDKLQLLTKQPTDNLVEIKKAIDGIQDDGTGMERVFSAVYSTAEWYRRLRIPDEATREPERNVMIIAFTDEAGSDQDGLDKTVAICRRYEMPVYVIGVPAPFGQRETLIKWVDPDPKYDQTPQWGKVVQGPESLLSEKINLRFSGQREEEAPIDSGFGPYGLTRLCYETGGIYFAVHPNRNVNRAVSRGETSEYSAHLKHFFDPEVMRKYRPDYVSAKEYQSRVTANKARMALVEAARRSAVNQMDSPTTEFIKRNEADFANALTEAQKEAAKVEPRIDELYNVLKLGEGDREKESSLRWQAGFDLAMGRVLAVKARTEGYNQMLAAAKRGLKFKEEKSNTWLLAPADDFSNVDSKLEKMADRARMYLQRVVKEHPGTPWAMLAQRELNDQIGWRWTEKFTDLSPPPAAVAANNNNNAPPPSNDQKKMLQKPPPARPIPNL